MITNQTLERYAPDVAKLIEASYPIRDAKRYINTKTLLQNVGTTCRTLSKCNQRTQLRMCTLVMSQLWGWQRYNTHSGGLCRGAVFIRPEGTS